MPSSSPQDAYAILASKIHEQVVADSLPAATSTRLNIRPGAKLGQQELAQKLVGKVLNRRLFKKALMTSVYGATPFRIRSNLMMDLHKLRVIEGK